MQSHFGLNEPVFTVDDWVTYNLLADVLNPLNVARYFLWGSGPFRKPSAYEASGFYRTGLNNASWPDVQIFFISAHMGSDGALLAANMYNYDSAQVRSFSFRAGKLMQLIF